MGDFATYGEWAAVSKDPLFLQQFPRVRSRADRLALLEQHRRWGAGLEAPVAGARIQVLPERRPGKLRLGFVSSNLHAHPVGLFAMPLFEHRDPRFELFAYSFRNGPSDPIQDRLASLSTFRHHPGLSARQGAELIAQDDIDLLIEINGVTNDQTLETMAYRPARRQASWLGYPHSTGLAAIDYIVLNRALLTDLVLEQPIILPQAWLVLPEGKFNEGDPIDPRLPEQRNGFLTFGTMNNPYKFTSDNIRTWARIVAACPGSKFMFGRPEAEAPSFQRGMVRRFEAEGVSADRLIFRDEPGRHMALYNEIDICLDTFPLTGGVTTCESLWMGVPVVTLVGEALFERISYGLLAEAGLADLAGQTPAEYEAVAIALAANRPRREAERLTLRRRLQTGSMGQPAAFAETFYSAMEATMRVAWPR